jgi:hypothetical protein
MIGLNLAAISRRTGDLRKGKAWQGMEARSARWRDPVNESEKAKSL